MKNLLLIALLGAPLFAGDQRFTACLTASTCANVSLVATATALTLQQPATASEALQLESATVYCSVACTITQSQNATTPATATATTSKPVAPVQGAANGVAYSASNASGGVVIPPVITLPAGSTITIDLSKITIPIGTTKSNYTVAISAITGDANISITWREVQ